jgi:hypothetical protein
MICDKCNATTDETKIYGYFVNDDLEIYCSKCTPYRKKGQKSIKEFKELKGGRASKNDRT